MPGKYFLPTMALSSFFLNGVFQKTEVINFYEFIIFFILYWFQVYAQWLDNHILYIVFP